MFENSISPEEPPRRPVAKDAHTDDVAKHHGLYTADRPTLFGRERVYYADYQQKSVVMRAQESRITTKLDDRQTISAVLDLAEARGWDRIRLSGSDSFRREAWVQAQERGIEVSGYKPKETDMQEAARRQAPSRQVPPRPVSQPTEKAPLPGLVSEKAVWGAVETVGKAARDQDAARSGQKAAEKSTAAEAA